jgi:uncharacterized metal-binding protein
MRQMVDLPDKKVGIIACSGEDLPEGTISRVAARKVLDDLRPGETVTLCLPLFLAGDEKERAFAKSYPTIAVDGCGKLCAKRATEKYSGAVSSSVVVDRLLQERGLSPGSNRRELDEQGQRAVTVVAEEIAQQVAHLLGSSSYTQRAPQPSDAAAAGATCCGGATVPISRVEIGGASVGLVALEPIFEQMYQQGHREGAGVDEEILKAVKVYNFVPSSAEHSYKATLLEEYRRFCRDKEG